MCRDVNQKMAEQKMAEPQPSLSEQVEMQWRRLEIDGQRLDYIVEDLYAIAGRIGMSLPSCEPRASEPTGRG